MVFLFSFNNELCLLKPMAHLKQMIFDLINIELVDILLVLNIRTYVGLALWAWFSIHRNEALTLLHSLSYDPSKT